MNRIQNSIAAKLILIVSGCMALLCAAIIAFASNAQQNQYFEELKELGKIVNDSLSADPALIARAKEQIKSQPAAYQSAPEAKALQQRLDGFIGSGKLSNAYLFYPDSKTADGKTYLVMMLANKKLYDGGLKPMTDYELTPEFMEAYDEALRSGVGITDAYRDQTGTWVSVLFPVAGEGNGTIAYAGVDFEYGSVQAELRREIWINISIGLVLGALFIAIVGLAIRFMLKPVRQLTQLSQQAAKGDLTVSIPVRQRDEIGQLADHFNAMIAGIRELIGGVRELGVQVGQSAETLQANADQTAKAAEQAAAAVQEVAAGAEQQMQSAGESSRAMAEMAAGIQRIAESAGEAAEASSQAYKQAEQGNEEIRANASRMDSIRQTVERSSAAIAELGELSRQIGHITEAIADIAGQTHLLALNAAIEAARAGEHGRGFSVVSDSIRKLAEQSRQSSEQIGGLVRTIREQTERAALDMRDGTREVQGLAVIVERIGDTFGQIVRSVESVNRQMHEVSASTEQMSAGSEQVTASIAELSAISQRSAAASQSVAAQSEEQLASMEEITASAASMRELAGRLRQTVERFRL
ncbi:methyl-accepting chemotaxis protein [Paenibacillus sp. GYB003]|uniref:methyl-accepting chemotaxis protein n=1 Tax=Paenibacillus sp. GYB003 TaxID=2994392 RepID=UPI002F9646A4